VSVTWLGRASGGLSLQDAVRTWVGEHRDRIAPALAETEQKLADLDVDVEMRWDSPEPDSEHPSANFYAWLAGESACSSPGWASTGTSGPRLSRAPALRQGCCAPA
jgi:hypothetical protein